nr:N-acetylmuramoyl-L-alanine amidase [Propionibacterium sp.]
MTAAPRRAAATPRGAAEATAAGRPARAIGAAPRRAEHPRLARLLHRHHRPAAAVAVAAVATLAGLALPNLAPGGPSAVPAGTLPRLWTPTTPASPDSVTTFYAAGAFATPQTGGMRMVPSMRGPLTGKVIVIDPGHNGRYSRSINERNYYTYGAGWRPCVQAGTTTYTNVTEHTIVWQVANRVVPLLLARGATVVLTRPDDDGYGPCNNERPEIANREGASLFLSLHVDGNEDKTLRGFYVAHSTKMAGGEGVQAASAAAAQIVARHLLNRTSLPGSNYVGQPGNPVYVRTDLAVLDGIRGAPAVLIESGNSRSPADVAYLTGADTQQEYAAALAAAAEEIVLTLPADLAAGPSSASPAAPPEASRPPTTSTPSPLPTATPAPVASPSP